MDDEVESLFDSIREDMQRLERENEALKRGFAEYMGLRELAVYLDLSMLQGQG